MTYYKVSQIGRVSASVPHSWRRATDIPPLPKRFFFFYNSHGWLGFSRVAENEKKQTDWCWQKKEERDGELKPRWYIVRSFFIFPAGFWNFLSTNFRNEEHVCFENSKLAAEYNWFIYISFSVGNARLRANICPQSKRAISTYRVKKLYIVRSL